MSAIGQEPVSRKGEEMKKYSLIKASMCALGVSLMITPTAFAQEPSTRAPFSHSPQSGSDKDGLMSPGEVDQAEKDGNPIYRIQSADENGFEADVTNARIVNNGDHISLIDKNGRESLRLNSRVYLKDGSSVKVNFKTNGNHISGKYEGKVPMDQVVILSGSEDRSAAGCASGVLLSVGAVAGGAAGILSAPLTGPVGPLATVAAAAGIAGSVGAAAAECSGR